MFENPELLDPTKHKHLRFKPVADFWFAAGLASAPLIASEVVKAAKHYPVVFSTDGPLLPLAMLSVKEGVNAFVGSRGEWLAAYVPAHVRRYPFIFGNTDDADRYTLMFVRDAPHFWEADGEPLFTEDGERGAVLAKAVDFLTAFQRELVDTEKLMAPLAETGVLTMQRIDITRTDGASVSFKGFRTVDREKLTALDDTTLANWVRNGLMGLIDAHLGSLWNFGVLAARQGVGTPAEP